MDEMTRAEAEKLAHRMAAQANTIKELNDTVQRMVKIALERILNTEMDHHLNKPKPIDSAPISANDDTIPQTSTKRKPNRRNGYSEKTISGSMGTIDIITPRDRDGTFEPILIPKYQRRLPDFDAKILALYAKGMTTRDIEAVVKEMYDVEVSPSLISDIIAELDSEVSAWRNRRLDEVYPIVYLDGIVMPVRNENCKVVHQTMYVALGVKLNGQKEVLGLWMAETEGAKFWLQCLTDLKNRGVADLFVVCIDGLSGFADAIRAVYPQAKVQRCIVHLVRNALRYTNNVDSPEVVKDLKTIYTSGTRTEAETALDAFEKKWGKKYPTIVKQWRENWGDIIVMFEFPMEIRRVLYTTNAIESVNSVIRKLTRNRKQFPSVESALKSVWLAIREATKRWTHSVRDWRSALNHFAVMFAERMPAKMPS